MANSLALPTNNTSVVLWFIQVQKQGDKKERNKKKHVTVYVVNYWDMHMSSFLEGRFIPLYIQTGSLPYLSS
jgi:hypothetical protein